METFSTLPRVGEPVSQLCITLSISHHDSLQPLIALQISPPLLLITIIGHGQFLYKGSILWNDSWMTTLLSYYLQIVTVETSLQFHTYITYAWVLFLFLRLSIWCTRFKTSYSSCTGRSSEIIYVAAVEALEEKKRQDETQLITKIGGKTSLGPSYFVL